MRGKRTDCRYGRILDLGSRVIIGTAAGLLLPPKPGKQTRHFGTQHNPTDAGEEMNVFS